MTQNKYVKYTMPKLTFKTKTLATVIAVFSAVALPQLFHLLGKGLGIGTSLGEILLPMHLPVLMLGILAGPVAGIFVGLTAPFISHFLTGMPGEAMLVFIAIELMVYGAAIGLMKNVNIPTIAKVLVAQLTGRAVRAIAILVSVHLMGNTVIEPTIILTSVKVGLAGMLIQLVLLPLFVRIVGEAEENEH